MSFESVKLVLVVGICGGVPLKSNKEEILLGDVVVSNTVIQYNFGRRFPDLRSIVPRPSEHCSRFSELGKIRWADRICESTLCWQN
jgi:nucleoside phosphorylase